MKDKIFSSVFSLVEKEASEELAQKLATEIQMFSNKIAYEYKEQKLQKDVEELVRKYGERDVKYTVNELIKE